MEHIFGKGAAQGGKGGSKPPPARGAVAGVKADYERFKQTGDYDPKNPNGVGMAWTHNFLNQKPWHPMSFKNRMKVWEHEQDKTEKDKIKEKAQAEFDAEQEYLKTLSYLSPEEQRRYREVQSVSFMYQKPPGLDAALARDAEAEKKKAAQQATLEAGPSSAAGAAGAGGSGAGVAGEGGAAAAAAGTAPAAAAAAAAAPDPGPSRAAMVDRLREDPFAAMLAAKAALANNPKFALAQPRDVGVFGGIRPDAHNQQLLTEDPVEVGAAAQDGSAELEFLLGLPPDQQLKALRRIAKKRKKEEEERKLREAEAVLRAAGYDLTAMEAGGGGGKSSKHKKKRFKSKGHKHKEEDKSRKSKKRRRGSDSGSGSDSSDSGDER
ncbi:hypothetical protein HYH02_007197 [Chlamydomonas schloesseri]|uniref:CBF1-interacting co-repressor CIR N-terminal domain-containing protein n=1 Tax=Chlamydomonas schloesseri TaxID=2026947 RepID=A0A835WI03_9CHLO|nr:hypothetical protein HYH02_007197 [Chlamydomonas schloesseri]|eukprot:KAG2447737.1 hypothetical protein HYH02_007197 [Chlamydomonas schloesseri]